MENKKAQVTLFIIVGIVIVAGIILLFLLPGNLSIIKNPTQNPQAYIEDCILESLKQQEQTILESNALTEKNLTNYFLYAGEKVPYLCTVSEYYSACMPQQPLLNEKIRKTMENKLSRDTESCFLKLKEEFQARGYDVNLGSLKLNLSFLDNQIKTEIEKRFSAQKQETSIQLKDFPIEFNTPLPNLLKLEQTITNYETTYCEFDSLAWMETFSDIKIRIFESGDQTKVYTLEDRITKKSIKFAIKTCVLPAGI